MPFGDILKYTFEILKSNVFAFAVIIGIMQVKIKNSFFMVLNFNF